MEVTGQLHGITTVIVGRCPQYPWNMRLNRLQSLSGSFGEEEFSCSGIPKNFVWGSSTNSVEDRGHRERGSGGGSPLVRCSAQFASE
jgi:hypothetical protein